MTLARTLKERTESYWNEGKRTNPFLSGLFQGTLPPEAMARFLVHARHLVSFTPAHLSLAVKEAEKRSLPQLAAYLAEKHAEEQGHDEWANDDLKKITTMKGMARTQPAEIDPSMTALVQHNEALIRKDPTLYLAYIFFAEYSCVYAGPDLVEAQEKKCGFPQGSLTIISKHAELDQHHVAEWEEVIGTLVDARRYGSVFHDTMESICRHHGNVLAAMIRQNGKKAA